MQCQCLLSNSNVKYKHDNLNLCSQHENFEPGSIWQILRLACSCSFLWGAPHFYCPVCRITVIMHGYILNYLLLPLSTAAVIPRLSHSMSAARYHPILLQLQQSRHNPGFVTSSLQKPHPVYFGIPVSTYIGPGPKTCMVPRRCCTPQHFGTLPVRRVGNVPLTGTYPSRPLLLRTLPGP